MKNPIKNPLLKRIVRDVILAVFLLVKAFFKLLPLKMGLSIGSALGKLCFHILPYERKVALKNLHTAFPEKSKEERALIAKESFANLGMSLCEILSMSKIRAHFDDYVTADGLEHLENATKEKGCLYITGHVGNWELMACYLAHKGFKITPIAREVYDKRINDILINTRKENGVDTILRDKPDTSRNIIKALRGHGVVGMLIDQDTNVQGIFVDFFGEKAYTTIGPASLALKIKCPVVAGFIHRDGERHKISIVPLDIIESGNKEDDIYSNTLMYSKAVEEAIRKRPTEWVWMHKRWKRAKKRDQNET